MLQGRIEQTAALSGGSVAVAVRDLTDGSVAAVNADRTVPAASLFKLPILVEVLKQQRLRRLDPEQKLEILPSHWTDGSGVLQARVGERVSVRELTRLMIQESDNIAALVLLDAVGAENVNATMDSLGLTSTRVRNREQGEAGAHTTSARDMARLLETAATGQLIDPQTSEEALRLLETRQAQSWLTQSLPWWVKVAHKWGELPGVRNDAGVIYTPDRTFIVVVLANGGSPDGQLRAIVETARAAYETLRG